MLPSLGWVVWGGLFAAGLYILMVIDRTYVGWKETEERRAVAPGKFIKLTHGETHYTYTPKSKRMKNVREMIPLRLKPVNSEVTN